MLGSEAEPAVGNGGVRASGDGDASRTGRGRGTSAPRVTAVGGSGLGRVFPRTAALPGPGAELAGRAGSGVSPIVALPPDPCSAPGPLGTAQSCPGAPAWGESCQEAEGPTWSPQWPARCRGEGGLRGSRRRPPLALAMLGEGSLRNRRCLPASFLFLSVLWRVGGLGQSRAECTRGPPPCDRGLWPTEPSARHSQGAAQLSSGGAAARMWRERGQGRERPGMEKAGARRACRPPQPEGGAHVEDPSSPVAGQAAGGEGWPWG